jgi:hypothetical protein
MPSASASGRTTRAATPNGRRCRGTNEPGGGFTARRAPVAPDGRPGQCNVADQEADPTRCWPSPGGPSPAAPAATTWPSGRTARSLARGHLGLRPGDRHDGDPQHVGLTQRFEGVPGTITVSTDRATGGVDGGGRAHLGRPWSGAVIEPVTPAVRALHHAGAGHTAPLLALARRLVDDGHEVVFFTTEHYRDRVRRPAPASCPSPRVRRPRPDGGQPRARGRPSAASAA